MVERFEMRVEDETLSRIDDWRRKQSDMPSRAEAARRLISVGLEDTERDRLYQIARFNLLVAAKNGACASIDDSYIYAWENNVYPAFHDHPDLHKPFAQSFRTSALQVEEIGRRIDELWLAGKPIPSFYQLENLYDLRSERSEWDRSKLIRTCRYMFLNKMFDDAVWGAILSRSDHPVEASSIIDDFNRQEDVWF